MTMSDSLQPGSVPWPLPTDNRQDFPTDFGSETWPTIWPKLIFRYANTAARDADLAGLSSTDRAFAFVEDTKTFWRWNGSAWVTAAPWVQSGTQGFSPGDSAVAAGGTVDVTITFPVAFPDAGYMPTIMTSFQAGRLTPCIVSRSAGSMQVRFFNNSSSSSVTGATIYWSATRVL